MLNDSAVRTRASLSFAKRPACGKPARSEAEDHITRLSRAASDQKVIYLTALLTVSALHFLGERGLPMFRPLVRDIWLDFRALLDASLSGRRSAHEAFKLSKLTLRSRLASDIRSFSAPSMVSRNAIRSSTDIEEISFWFNSTSFSIGQGLFSAFL